MQQSSGCLIPVQDGRGLNQSAWRKISKERLTTNQQTRSGIRRSGTDIPSMPAAGAWSSSMSSGRMPRDISTCFCRPFSGNWYGMGLLHRALATGVSATGPDFSTRILSKSRQSTNCCKRLSQKGKSPDDFRSGGVRKEKKRSNMIKSNNLGTVPRLAPCCRWTSSI